MPKKSTRPKRARAKLLSAEIEAQREAAQLRRLKRQHRTIARLSKQLAHAVTVGDGSRIGAAHALCRQTTYAVYERSVIDAYVVRLEELTQDVDKLRARIQSNATEPSVSGR